MDWKTIFASFFAALIAALPGILGAIKNWQDNKALKKDLAKNTELTSTTLMQAVDTGDKVAEIHTATGARSLPPSVPNDPRSHP